MPLSDHHERPLRNLRLSVTDRCNLRCDYCMPEEEYTWLPRNDILSFGEIAKIVETFVSVGVEKVRLTGGEPLLRRDLPTLVAKIAEMSGVRDLAMTTNGILLEDAARELAAAGLDRVTVSLDTLKPERFQELTKRRGLDRVLSALESLPRAGFENTRIDTVVMRGVNDDELIDLLDAARELSAELRFIEYMDVGGATTWSAEKVVSRAEILAHVESACGPVTAITPESDLEAAAPADRFRMADGTTFGVISSTTAPFCSRCDRSRITADGTWYLCLYARLGIDLKTPLRAGETEDELRARITRVWGARDDRGAEERLALEERGSSIERDELSEDPRLEMHTRGG